MNTHWGIEGMTGPWLNYHHLFYFWTVARSGSIAEASRELRLSPPTISVQLKNLESVLGHALFERVGRRLELTDVGQEAYRYCEEIFRLGREFQKTLSDGTLARRRKVSVGVAEVVPKLIAERFIQPALDAQEGAMLECREAPLPELLSQLALHELDVVIADAPASPGARVKVFHHLLGECGLSVVAHPKWASLRKGFPHSLHGRPALLSASSTAVRRHIEGWLSSKGIEPDVVAEFEDSALLKVFGQRGRGFFWVPTVVEKEVCRQYDVVLLGRVAEVTERFYAITVERKLKHPAILAMVEEARERWMPRSP